MHALESSRHLSVYLHTSGRVDAWYVIGHHSGTARGTAAMSGDVKRSSRMIVRCTCLARTTVIALLLRRESGRGERTSWNSYDVPTTQMRARRRRRGIPILLLV